MDDYNSYNSLFGPKLFKGRWLFRESENSIRNPKLQNEDAFELNIRNRRSSTTKNLFMKINMKQAFITIIIMIFLFKFNLVQARNALEAISDNPQLSMFKELVENEKILYLMMAEWPMTVFAPTNDALKEFKKKNQFDSDLFKYHIVNLLIKREEFASSPVVTSFNGKMAPLYLSVVDNSILVNNPNNQLVTGEKSYFVNNALIIDAVEDLESKSNSKQALYVIDEVLNVYKPSEAFLPPTALELIREPSLYGLSLDLKPFLQHIEANKQEALFSASGANSFFVPSKIATRGGITEFDSYVVKSHVVKSKALFVRTMGDRRNYHTLAHDDAVDVELSFVNKSVRFASEKTYYIQTNTIKNDVAHKVGRVLSKLITANIPVKNGVLHIIEKPLMLMDMSVKDFLKDQPKLKKFSKLLEKHQDLLNEINRNPNKTVLAPDDNAFTNLMDNNQNFAGINEDSQEMKKLLRQHIVYQQISSSDLKKSAGFANYTSASGIPVVFRLIGSEPHSRLTVESGGVNATSTVSDLGASDGILHIIDRVLGMPFNTIYEKMISNPMMNETFKIGSQGGTQNWNSKLLDKNKRYTFFAPSNEAWLQFAQENPSEFKQLDTGIYPSISRAILDRHLSAKGQFSKKDLEQTVKKVDTIQGELIISPDPSTRDIYIEWEGKRAKIINSDIHGLNGVIHVIDQVLAKRRDFVVNRAATLSKTGCHIILVIYLIYFSVSCLGATVRFSKKLIN